MKLKLILLASCAVERGVLCPSLTNSENTYLLKVKHTPAADVSGHSIAEQAKYGQVLGGPSADYSTPVA
jgi:hypothetical protein